MNLLIVTETYPPEINGVARTLAQMVSGLVERGHRVTLVKPAQNGSQSGTGPEHERVEVRGVALPGYPGLQFGLPARQRIRRALADGAVDAAYIATEGPLGHSALRACAALRIPALSGMHTNFHQYSDHYGAGLLGPAMLRYLRHFHNRLAGTLVPTGAMAASLREIGFRRLKVWPRGVRADLFTPVRRSAELRASWGLGEDGLGVLYVGRLAPEKNIDMAFEAFDAIRARHADARLILVGSGPAEQRLREAHPDALFTGSLVGETLAEHYASSDLFLFPSQTETFGNVTLEAMASGLAVVAYDLAAAHELMVHGRNGLLADPASDSSFADLARHCATDHGLRRSLARHARETALQQAWPTLIEHLERLLDAVIRENGIDDNESAATSAKRP